MLTGEGKRGYAGLVTLATGFRWWAIPLISPDIDSAREELSRDLQRGGRLSYCSGESFVKQLSRKESENSPFFTDGRIVIITLR